jgi:hypothetical protein
MSLGANVSLGSSPQACPFLSRDQIYMRLELLRLLPTDSFSGRQKHSLFCLRGHVFCAAPTRNKRIKSSTVITWM